MIWKCFCKWKIDLNEKNKNLEKGNRRPVVQRLEQTACRLACMHCRSVAEANDVSFGVCARCRSRVGSNGVSFVRMERPVVRISKKRRVVSCDRTICRSCPLKPNFPLNKTTSFWTCKTTPFCLCPAAPVAPLFLLLSSALPPFATEISLSHLSLSHSDHLPSSSLFPVDRRRPRR